MDKVYVFRAACRKNLRLRRDSETFLLLEGCSERPGAICVRPGDTVYEAMTACKLCSKPAELANSAQERTCTDKEQGMGNNDETRNGIPGTTMPVLTTPPPGAPLNITLQPQVEQIMVGDVIAANTQVYTPAIVMADAMLDGMSVVEPIVDQASLTPQQIIAPVSQQVQLIQSPFLPQSQGVTQASVRLSQPEQLPHQGTPAQALLTNLLLGSSGEEMVDVDAVLNTIPGLNTGPSVGGFSWHTLELCMRCWRLAYLYLAQGVMPKQKSRALAFGSLYHACWEVWYTSGGQRKYDEPCDAVRKAGAPRLAGEVQRLVYTELQKYAAMEAIEWDIRAIENNAVYFGEPERINGKLVYLPISCRHDMLIGKRRPGEGCAPPGPVRSGIWVVDHKCLHHAELVWDAVTGERKPAREMLSGTRLPSVYLSAGQALLRSDEARFSDNGIREVFRLELDSGRVIRRTAEEPVLTSRGWRRIEELQKGEFVACAPLTEVQGKDCILDGEAELLGYLVGDGSLRGDGVVLSTHRKDLMERFCAVLDQLKDEYHETAPRANGELTCRLRNGSGVYAAVENAGLLNKRAPDKFVPAAVLCGTKRQVAIFVAAIWSTDGSIKLNFSGASRSLSIRYNSRSEQLVIDLQQLLWRLGIWSTRRPQDYTYNGKQFVQWELEVAGRRDKRKFIELLGDKIIYRAEDVDQAACMDNLELHEGSGRDADGIPSHLVVEALQEHRKRTGEMKIAGRYIAELVQDNPRRRTVSRWLVEALACHANELEPLVRSPVRWDRVVSCEANGPAPTIAVELPINPVYVSAEGVVTHNTSSALTYDITKGYAMDGQFLTNALVFTRSSEQEEFGPFQGMIFAVAVKHKEPTPEKSFFRVETMVEDAALDEFYRTELRPYAVELYRRLTSDECKNDPSRWPKNHAACVGRYGTCKYFDLCDIGGDSILDAMYIVDPKAAFRVDRLAEPPAEVRRATRLADPVKQVADAVRKTKTEDKKSHAADLLEAFRASALALEPFQKHLYLVPNATRKTVADQLAMNLSTAWPVGTTFPFPDTKGLTYDMTVEEKGIAWKLLPQKPADAPEGRKKGRPATAEFKGRLTWKAIAESICRDWWDLSHLEPNK